MTQNLKHVGYLFISPEGGVVYSPSGFGMKGFTCAGKIYGDVGLITDSGSVITDNAEMITDSLADKEGWIEWKGGLVSPVTCRVDVRYRNGIEAFGCKAGDFSWKPGLGGVTIVAYRIIKDETNG